jgi:hypothetical protein
MARHRRSRVALLRLHMLLHCWAGVVAIGLLHRLAVAGLLWGRVSSHLCRRILLIPCVHTLQVPIQGF